MVGLCGFNRIKHRILYLIRASQSNRAAGVIFAGALLAGGASGQSIPAEFQAAYTETSNIIKSFDQTVTTQWNGLHSPVSFAGELSFANSARVSGLLNSSGLTSIFPSLNQLQAL